MAKHCDVCNKSYPETEAHCPHCAAAAADEPHLAEADDSAVDLGEPVVAEAASSSGHHKPAEPKSGSSAVAWVSLVEDADDSSVKIDSPSDADLLAHAAAKAPAGEPFVAEMASGTELPGAVPQDSSSALDLGARAAHPAEEAADAEVDSSTVNLGGEAEREASPPHLAALANEPEGAGAEDFVDDVAAVEAGSAVDLGEAARSPERPSGRDLIAEAVESGVDLGESRPADAEAEAVLAEASGSAVDLGSAIAEGGSGSGSDGEPDAKNSSRHDIDLDSAAAEAVEAPSSDADVDLAKADNDDAGPPESSAVDLGGSAARAPKLVRAGSSANLDLDAEEAAADREAMAADEAEQDEEPAPPKSKRKKPAVEEEDEDEAAAQLAGGGDETVAAEAEDEAPAGAAADDEEGEEAAPAKSRRPAADEEEEDKPAPKKSAKARSGCGCLLVGCLLGLLVGAGGSIGLALFDIVDPAKALGALVGIKPSSDNNQAKSNPKDAPKPPIAAPVEPGEHLHHGDFAKALEGLKDVPAEKTEALAQRGTALWLQYLQEQMAKDAQPKADDEVVKEARKDLETAAQKDNPEALLSLGNLLEYTAGRDEALKTYRKGVETFQAKPTWARAFQAQIDRLESVSAAPAPGGKPGAESRRPAEDRDAAARALLVLLIAFQQAPPAADDEEEAGFDFWAAVKAAQSGDYAAALKSLEAARKAHDKMRFKRLRKAQNSLSDPTEEIFLRSTKEIAAYWQLQEYLSKQKLLAKGGDPRTAVDGLVKANADLQGQLKDVADKLKTTPDKLLAGIETLTKEKDDAAKKALTLETDLTAAKKDLVTSKKEAKELSDKLALAGDQRKTADGKLKSVGARLEAAGIKEADPAKGVDALADERAAADKTLTTIAERIALAHVKVEKKNVLPGVDRVVEMALVNDPKGELLASRDEIRRLDGVLAQRRTPQEMLDVWLPILADRTQKEAAHKAIVDAERTRDDVLATPATKRKALAVLGLAQRNLGDFDKARVLLTDAVGGAALPRPEWTVLATAALKELTDPAAYYLPHARELYEEGKNQEALDALTLAAKLFPKDVAVMLPLRSQVRLEMAREKGKGKTDPADPLVAEARKDAEAAGNAEGHYALGRIAEELGDLANAKASYAKALAAHGDSDEAGLRYRVALARVLKLQAEQSAGGRAAAGARSSAAALAEARRQPLMTLLLLVELSFQAAPGPEQDAAAKLIDEVLAAKEGPDTFMLRAEALALKGLWTPALKTYATGLRPHIRRDYADGLASLIERHPALRRPSGMEPPNPVLAEARYATGLRHYFPRHYVDAEASFAGAIEADNQDARYFYFLGLSHLALNRRDDAHADFEEGARLEEQNRPGREAVSTALERVQGTARQAVNRFRP